MGRSAAAVSAVLGLAAVFGLAGCGSASLAPGQASSSGSGLSVSSPASGSPFRGALFARPHPRPSFVLTDQRGRRYDFAARTRGRPTLLFFGFTRCPDICPTTMADVAAALRTLPDLRDSVQVVFVTTDPKRDTPAALASWLASFDRDLPAKFIGLTGSQAEIDVAQRGAGVELARDGGLTHSAQLLLYGPDDLCRVFYLAGSAPEDIAHDLPLVATGVAQ